MKMGKGEYGCTMGQENEWFSQVNPISISFIACFWIVFLMARQCYPYSRRDTTENCFLSWRRFYFKIISINILKLELKIREKKNGIFLKIETLLTNFIDLVIFRQRTVWAKKIKLSTEVQLINTSRCGKLVTTMW